MKIELVCKDWLGPDNESVYMTEKGIELSRGDFHSGTTFRATIETDNSEWLQAQLDAGFTPVFYVVSAERRG